MKASLRRVRRYREIARVLGGHGFGFLLDYLGITSVLALPARLLRRHEEPPARPTVPVRVRRVLESLGPTFIKIGQLLSTRPDLIPPDLLQELAVLQDQIPPVPTAEIRALVARELGRSFEEVFAAFDDQPVASASIGQVHRAVLRDGGQVVVKVQRPGIADIIRVDLDILAEVAGILDRRSPWANLYDFSEAVGEFAETIREELDFRLEGQNADRFQRNFTDDPRVRFPRVYREYTTGNMLVLEFIDGTKITEVERLEEAGLNRPELAGTLVQSLLKQAFVDGFFHGDPHPGNILVDGHGKIVFLDLGMVGYLDGRTRTKLAGLILGIVKRRPARIVAAMSSLGIAPPGADPARLQRDVERAVGRYYHVPLQELDMRVIMQSLLEIAFRHRLRIPTDLTLLVKALSIVEGIARRLDPSLSLVEVAEPFGRVLVRQKLSWGELEDWYRNDLLEYGKTLLGLPVRINKALDRLNQGQLTMRHLHEGLSPIVERLTGMINRLAMSILAASIIIGTSLLEGTKGETEIFHLPVGRLGLLAALVMGLWLLFSILRSRAW